LWAAAAESLVARPTGLKVEGERMAVRLVPGYFVLDGNQQVTTRLKEGGRRGQRLCHGTEERSLDARRAYRPDQPVAVEDSDDNGVDSA